MDIDIKDKPGILAAIAAIVLLAFVAGAVQQFSFWKKSEFSSLLKIEN